MSGHYIYDRLAAATLSDGRLQLWSTDQSGNVITFWKQASDPNARWTSASPFQTPQAGAYNFTVASLKDGRLHFFVVDGNWKLWSTQKQTSDANAEWTPLQPIDIGQVQAYCVAAVCLSDGRLQLFMRNLGDDQIWTTWQQSSNASSGWSPLSQFQTIQTVPVFIAAGRLSDGRLQLFVVDDAGQIWTAWKQSSDANAEWTALSRFQTPSTGAYIVAAGSLSDGRLQLFIVDNQDADQIWTTWKQATDPHAPWTSLTQLPSPQVGYLPSLAAGSLSDGRLQLFITDYNSEGPIWTTWKQATDPNSAWVPFSQVS